MAIQLKNRLQSALHVSARVSLFVAGLSVQELAMEIAALLEDGSTTPLQADPLANPEELLANLDNLSEQQVESLLMGALSDEEAEQ
jgi:hypothetical protein